MGDKTYIGIDNGVSGAVAILESDGSVKLSKTPTIEFGGKGTFIDDIKLRSLVMNGRAVEDLRVVYEWGNKNPQWGTKGNWATGNHNGTLTTFVRQNGIRAAAITAKEWQRELLAGFRPNGCDTKTAAKAAAKHYFPGVSLIAPGCRTEFDGFADALLMALWGKRRNL
jgi:hypothetical protein